MQSKLATDTLNLVQSRDKYRVTLEEIAVGAGVDREWLRSFVYGRINIHNAAVCRVEAVYNYMTNNADNHA